MKKIKLAYKWLYLKSHNINKFNDESEKDIFWKKITNIFYKNRIENINKDIIKRIEIAIK